MIRHNEIEITLEEIEALKKEWFETKTYHGTDKPIVLDDRSAESIIQGRKYHEAWLNSAHSTHVMSMWRSEIMCPASTPRFYAYRQCKNCGGEQYHHPAGKFMDSELEEECVGA